jgi:hypothetical protein
MWETMAVWLGAIALIAIFFLDWKEREENRNERQAQHEETAEQLQVAQSQADATMKSADAAMEAALAAKESAEIAAALHRPYMGLGHVKLSPGPNTQNRPVWSIEWSIKNFGTLPASQVEASVDIRLDAKLLLTDGGAKGAEVFPQSDSLTKISNFGWEGADGIANRSAVMGGQKLLIVRVHILYAGPSGRQYKHTADAQFNRAYGTFSIIESKTEMIK